LNERKKFSSNDIRKAVLYLGVLSFLVGVYGIYYSYFNRAPQQNDLTVVNGVFKEYDKGSGNRSTDSLHLKESGTAYEVSYFQDNPSQRTTFLNDVKQGQDITIWTYKHTGINTVLGIKSNNKTYLSLNDGVNYDIGANNQGKTIGISCLLLSGILLCFYWWVFRKNKAYRSDTIHT
jgi:hypothetical protein